MCPVPSSILSFPFRGMSCLVFRVGVGIMLSMCLVRACVCTGRRVHVIDVSRMERERAA